MPRILRPDLHITSEARALLDEAEDEGLIDPKGGVRRARILDDAYYEIEAPDEEGQAARATPRREGGT